MKKNPVPFILCGLVLVSLLSPAGAQKPAREEKEDYYKKWLTEDVAYIISAEEKVVFEKLTTDVEKEQFIEQFWHRRDPDPTTAENEYKSEFYRRIAYANQWFKSGKAGWQTDRGRIYIMHGQPDEIESHPSGGTYQRPEHEGGGFTSTHPFEIWRYKRIEGIGEDVELEFVDPVGGGEYRLSLDPQEKDALLHVPSAGLTWAEARGLSSKTDRLSYSGRDLMNPLRAKDNLFDRYEQFARVQAPQTIRNTDLQEIVKVDIAYSNLPFRVRQDYFRLSDDLELVAITLEIRNQNLTFREEESGVHVARAVVYGIVTSLSNRIMAEFEDTLLSSYQPQELERGLRARSLYQKIVSLPRNTRYKLDLVVKDVHSGNIGTIRQRLLPPSYPEGRLIASSLIFSDLIRAVGENPEENPMFVLGDVWVRPSMDNSFPLGSPIGVYLQLYNTAEDETTLAPSLAIRYRVLRDGDAVSDMLDDQGESIYYYSPRRTVLIKPLPVAKLAPARYRLEVRIRDLIADQEVVAGEAFEIVDPARGAAGR